LFPVVPQIFGEPGGGFRRVRHQWRGRVQAEHQQERETRHRPSAVRRGDFRERHSPAGARVAGQLRPAHSANLYAGRRG